MPRVYQSGVNLDTWRASSSKLKDDVSHISKLVKQQQTSLEGTSFDMSAAIQAQAIAVKNRINVLGSLQPAQSAELQELVLSGPWTDIQKGDISSAITAGCVASSTTARGPLSPKHQTLENFMGYLSVADSEKLADPCGEQVHEVGSSFLQGYCNWVVQARRKVLQEYSWCRSVCRFGTCPQEKLPMMTELKRMLRSSAKRHSHPTPWIDKYPCLPGDLPDTLRKAYEADPPARSWGWLPWTYLAARAAPCLVPS